MGAQIMRASVLLRVFVDVPDCLARKLGPRKAVEQLIADGIDDECIQEADVKYVYSWECLGCGMERGEYGPCYCPDEYKEWLETDKRG